MKDEGRGKRKEKRSGGEKGREVREERRDGDSAGARSANAARPAAQREPGTCRHGVEDGLAREPDG